jgi:Oxidoreductase family, C-terminal alpha/beta domain
VAVDHPVPLVKGMPTLDNSYNAAVTFAVRAMFPNGVEMMIRDKAQDLGFENGIMFEGDNGKFFVNRGKLTGKVVDDLATNPIPETKMTALRKGQPVDTHMGNFIRAARDRSMPISDVWTHHRVLTTCHLANIAMRLGRTLNWDAASEQITGDAEANAWQRREQRQGYETT